MMGYNLLWRTTFGRSDPTEAKDLLLPIPPPAAAALRANRANMFWIYEPNRLTAMWMWAVDD